MDIELNNINICCEIGSIGTSNCHYTAGITRAIAKTGKKIEQLTVAELLALHRKYNDQFNRRYR